MRQILTDMSYVILNFIMGKVNKGENERGKEKKKEGGWTWKCIFYFLVINIGQCAFDISEQKVL